MHEIIDKKHISIFTPCHHIIEIAEPILKVENSPSNEFETQEMNIKHILSNNLDVKENRNLQTLAHLPEYAQEELFSGIAQREFEKQILELKGKKFDMDYNSVPDSDPTP